MNARLFIRRCSYLAASLFGINRRQADLDEEVQFHIEMRAHDLRNSGMSKDEASREALKLFGGIEKFKEHSRDAWGTRMVTDSIRDVRHSIRSLYKSKGFSLTVLLTLGLGLGGNATVSSILSAVLGPPPYSEPNRVVEIFNNYPGAGIGRSSSNIPLYLDYRANVDALDFVALTNRIAVNITTDASAVRGHGLLATADYFRVFGIQPILGRFFEETHCIQGNDKVIVLTESFWRTHYASDSSIVGRTIVVDSVPLTVLGVAPKLAEWHHGDLDFFRAWAWSAQREQFEKTVYYGRDNNYANLWARLKSSSSIREAKAQIDYLESLFLDKSTQQTKDWRALHQHESVVETLQQSKIAQFGDSLHLLQGGLFLVLLIGCVNVGNLQLSRGLKRLPEIKTRVVLGASRWVLVRWLLIDSIVLSLGGFFCGLLLAWSGIHWVNKLVLDDMLPTVGWIGIDPGAIRLVLVLSILVALCIGAFALSILLGGNLDLGVGQNTTKISQSKMMKRLRSGLVSFQLAMTTILLLVAALLLQSFYRALNEDTGLNTEKVVVASVTLPRQIYRESETIANLRVRLTESLHQTPGVESVAFASYLPSLSTHAIGPARVPAFEELNGEDFSNVNYNTVSRDYFDALGIRVLEGNTFRLADLRGEGRGVVVDKEFADRYFPNNDALGKQICANSSRLLPLEKRSTIIGVVETVKHNGLDSVGSDSKTKNGSMPLVYLPLSPQSRDRELNVLVRGDLNRNDLVSEVRGHIQSLNSQLAIFRNSSLEQLLRASVNDRRAFMLLIAILGGMALLLSLVGIYGVLSFEIRQRKHEIGIRLAVGGSTKQMLGDILKQSLLRAGIGLTLGVLAAWFLGERLADLLFKISPNDPVVYFITLSSLLLVLLLASLVPALKVTRIQPIEALKID